MDDYIAVMPLPRRKKFGINFVFTPSWIQQLGIFSKVKISHNTLALFLSKIPKKFIRIDYRMNAGNRMDNDLHVKRKNYILDLNRDLDHIRMGFNSNRKRASKSDFNSFQINKTGEVNDFLELYKAQDRNFPMPKDGLEKLKNLMKLDNSLINIWIVTKKDEALAGLLWLKDKNRITYLVPVAKKEAKEYQLNSYIIFELIRDHQNSERVLDFEGSMIPGVERFYQSFGAIVENYPLVKKRFFYYV